MNRGFQKCQYALVRAACVSIFVMMSVMPNAVTAEEITGGAGGKLEFFAKNDNDPAFERAILQYLAQSPQQPAKPIKLKVVYDFLDPAPSSKLRGQSFSDDYEETQIFYDVTRVGCTQIARYRSKKETVYRLYITLWHAWQPAPEIFECLDKAIAFDAAHT